ncbi:MAG TPA: anti-sigma factor, partial [Pyrinomonadaceae bacterium]|nr:anti-sigma factor [Pyrinomonadaceae bacterium]
EYKEMLAAQALGALEPAEARELAEHLAACAECGAELGAWQDTASSLAYAAPPAEPPADLRSRVLAGIRSDGARRPAAKDGAVESGPRKTSRAESKVVPLARPLRPRWSAAMKVGALAASIAIIAMAAALVVLWNRYTAVQQEFVQLTDRWELAQGELRREREQLARRQEAIALITSPGARVTALAGTDVATRAHGKLVYDRDTGRAMLMAYDLPPAPSGKAYQLWFIAEGKPPMPGSVFNTDSAGRAEMREQLPSEARAATVFAVTLEPSGGVPAPTGAKYLLGSAS